MSEILVPCKKDLILTWDDYVGLIENTPQKAWTHTRLKYIHNTKLHKTKTKTKFQITNITVTAYYNKSTSWVKPEMKTRHDQAQILKHEQGHLDLAEMSARKIEYKMKKEFEGKKFTCKGKTEQEQIAFAKSESKKMLEEKWKELLPEWHNYETNYDDKTQHGMNNTAQILYDQIFDNLRK